MTAKYNPNQYWVATVKIILAAPSREAVIAALGSKLGNPSSDGMVADWGFAKDDNAEHGRGYPRSCFTNPRQEGYPEDFFALRDRVKNRKPAITDFEFVAIEDEYETQFDRI